MGYHLQFDRLLRYDLRQSGINIPVTLSLNQTVIDFDAKLDTGASDCISEREHGEALGLNIEQGYRKRFGTATGYFYAYGHLFTLAVENFEFELMAFFAEEADFGRNVLGRTGFLDRVLIGLNDYAGDLYLSRNFEGSE